MLSFCCTSSRQRLNPIQRNILHSVRSSTQDHPSDKCEQQTHLLLSGWSPLLVRRDTAAKAFRAVATRLGDLEELAVLVFVHQRHARRREQQASLGRRLLKLHLLVELLVGHLVQVLDQSTDHEAVGGNEHVAAFFQMRHNELIEERDCALVDVGAALAVHTRELGRVVIPDLVDLLLVEQDSVKRVWDALEITKVALVQRRRHVHGQDEIVGVLVVDVLELWEVQRRLVLHHRSLLARVNTQRELQRGSSTVHLRAEHDVDRREFQSLAGLECLLDAHVAQWDIDRPSVPPQLLRALRLAVPHALAVAQQDEHAETGP